MKSYTIEFSWETTAHRKSNVDWMLLYFKYPPAVKARGKRATFTITKEPKLRRIKQLASQCGGTVVEKKVVVRPDEVTVMKHFFGI